MSSLEIRKRSSWLKHSTLLQKPVELSKMPEKLFDKSAKPEGTMLLSRTAARVWYLLPVLQLPHLRLRKDSQKVWGHVHVVGCVVIAINNVQIVFLKVVSKESQKVRVSLDGQKGSQVDGTKEKVRATMERRIYFVDLASILSAHWDDDATHGRAPTRAVIDTGASENAIGIDSLHDLVTAGRFQYEISRDDLPTFRFGNGHRDQAVSRADISGTSLGKISFYVLDGLARSTPPLIGAQTLRGKHVMLSYSDGLFRYSEPNTFDQPVQQAVQMQALTSGHITIDLSEVPVAAPSILHAASMQAPLAGVESSGHCSSLLDAENSKPSDVSQKCCGHICMFSTEFEGFSQFDNVIHDSHESTVSCMSFTDRSIKLQQLASRLSSVRNGLQVGDGRPLSYVSKGENHGQERQAMPEPNLLRAAMEELERQIPKVDGDQGQDASGRHHSDDVDPHDVCGVRGETQEGDAWCDSNAKGQGGTNTADVPDDAGDPRGSDHGYSGSRECRAEGTSGGGGACGLACRRSGVPGSVEDGSPGRGGLSAEVGVREAPTGSERDPPACQGGGILHSSTASAERPIDARSGSANGSGGLGGGERESQEIQVPDEGTVKSLWHRLKSLRHRMTSVLGSTLSSTTDEAGTHPSKLECVFGSQVLDVSAAPQPIVPEKAVNPLHQIHCEPPPKHPVLHEHGSNSKKTDDPTRSKKNIVMPSLAKKLATSVAVFGASVALPVQGMFSQLQDAPDFAEVACAPNSALTERMESLGYTCKRYNYKNGYDLGSTKGTSMMKMDFRLHPPKFSWISLPCTRLSSLQNLTERTELEWSNFERRVSRDLKRADEVSDGVCQALDERPEADFAWEWPTGAVKGWKSRAIQRLLSKMAKLKRPVYWCRFHGCAYGLQYKCIPIQKSWTVLTSNRRLWMSLQKKCPGHPEHAQCRGVAAQASAYYPPKMVTAVTLSISQSWSERDAALNHSLTQDIEHYLLDIPDEVYGEVVEELNGHCPGCREEPKDEQPHAIWALSRTTFPKEPPVGRKLELIKQQMLRVHRAAGHPSFGNLQRLLRARGAPPWSIELAGSLKCPACIESQRPLLHPPASSHDDPRLFEIVGTDIFEYEHTDGRKHKFILWRDRASGYVVTQHLQEYLQSWEPTTSDVLNSFASWLMINPSPTWIISDAGVQYTSEEFQTFCMNSGIGLLTAPAEAHWILGAEEGCIKILKSSVARLMKEEPALTVPNAFALAAHGANHTIGATGFSAFQWVRGGATPQDPLLSGLDPRKAFGGILKLKEKARIAFEQEHAKYKLSKLNNALGRTPQSFSPGSLAMLWRQRMRPGKTTGHWQGPVRNLLQEGSTLWLGSGSTLIRAKTKQCRECTKREELQASLDGVAVLQQPVTLETLLRSFTGRHFTNVTGEAPSTAQMESDLAATDVRVAADPQRLVPDPRRGIQAPPAGDPPSAAAGSASNSKGAKGTGKSSKSAKEKSRRAKQSLLHLLHHRRL
eukprot:s182_g29.t1